MDLSYLQKEYGALKAPNEYRIIKQFKDYCGITYEIGTKLKFIGSNFVPYENGLSLFFDNNGVEQQIMLCVSSEFQQSIAHNLEEYFSECGK
ncbi:DUF3601 domain-containing protein [Vibrio nigripulchritudo]|uniref:DUF3601 domain-containing protein n=1 Tax=Vibrio nigripulchritudo TaxID=28173 RepID=UPI0007E50CF2|nr:DUF3601 domain-containing protein [Vibrio nigripulchritudo]